MRKILLGSILISTSALALGIDINTKIKWNSIVVVAAAHDVGLEAENNTHPEVSSTYYRILGDLLERETFSVADAVSVCNKECKKSQFLKEGRGQSGKKCPEICKSFGNALIEENNKGATKLETGNDGFYDSHGRIYTDDENFYALKTDKIYTYSRWGWPCSFAVFDAKNDKMIATCDEATGGLDEIDTGTGYFKIINSAYEKYKFDIQCNLRGRTTLDCILYVDFPGRDEYIDLYESAQKCANSLSGITIDDVLRAIKQNETYGYILSDRETKLLSQTFDSIDFVSKFTRYTPISWDMYNSLKFDYDTYCSKLNYIEKGMVRSYRSGKELIDAVDDTFNKLPNYFQTHSAAFAKKQVKNLSAAVDTIAYDIYSTCRVGPAWAILDKNKLKNKLQCSGDCNKFGQDYVTCTLGPLKAIFEFDDICQSKVEGLLNSMF